MYSQWLKTEHDRLHIIEQWPDGPAKSAALAAIRSSLASLARIARPTVCTDCETCLNRQRAKLHVLTPAGENPPALAA